jgi:hypothetical protein
MNVKISVDPKLYPTGSFKYVRGPGLSMQLSGEPVLMDLTRDQVAFLKKVPGVVVVETDEAPAPVEKAPPIMARPPKKRRGRK